MKWVLTDGYLHPISNSHKVVGVTQCQPYQMVVLMARTTATEASTLQRWVKCSDGTIALKKDLSMVLTVSFRHKQHHNGGCISIIKLFLPLCLKI